MRIPNAAFPHGPAAVVPAIESAGRVMDETGLPFAFVMAKGSVAAEALDEAPLSFRTRGTLGDLTEGAEPPTQCHVGFFLDEQYLNTLVVLLDADDTVAQLGLHVLLPRIARLKNVAIGVDRRCVLNGRHGVSSSS